MCTLIHVAHASLSAHTYTRAKRRSICASQSPWLEGLIGAASSVRCAARLRASVWFGASGASRMESAQQWSREFVHQGLQDPDADTHAQTRTTPHYEQLHESVCTTIAQHTCAHAPYPTMHSDTRACTRGHHAIAPRRGWLLILSNPALTPPQSSA